MALNGYRSYRPVVSLSFIVVSIASTALAFTEAIVSFTRAVERFCAAAFQYVASQVDAPRFAGARTETATGFFRRLLDPALANSLRHEAGMRPVPT